MSVASLCQVPTRCTDFGLEQIRLFGSFPGRWNQRYLFCFSSPVERHSAGGAPGYAGSAEAAGESL